MEVKLPLPYVITAAGYVEKYGPDERYNYLRFLARVPCPTLITLGSLEVTNNMAFRGVPEALAALGNGQGRLRSRHPNAFDQTESFNTLGENLADDDGDFRLGREQLAWVEAEIIQAERAGEASSRRSLCMRLLGIGSHATCGSSREYRSKRDGPFYKRGLATPVSDDVNPYQGNGVQRA